MASIIKAGNIQQSTRGARHVAFNLEDMSDNASHYVDSVKQHAARIVAEARKEAEAIRVRAEQQGKQAALDSARQAVAAEMDAKWKTLQPALRQAIVSVEQLKHDWLHQWQRNTVHLAIAIAQRVVRGELRQRPEISEQWIREALELASGSQKITLHLNPRDYDALGERPDVIAEAFDALSSTDVVADPEISAGGCRIVTTYGTIDQQLENQLARLEEELNS